MSAEVKIDILEAFRQASLTAANYLDQAYEILDKGINDYTASVAIALANIMALDFNNTMDNIKMQELGDAVNGVAVSLDAIATALCKVAEAVESKGQA